jgi:hypothetical protein
MGNLNTLTAVIQNIRITTESQSYRAAATLTAESLLFSKSRRVTYTTVLYENGTYEAAKEKLDALKAMPTMTDLSLDITDPDKKIYSVTATEKVEGAWSAWSS